MLRALPALLLALPSWADMPTTLRMRDLPSLRGQEIPDDLPEPVSGGSSDSAPKKKPLRARVVVLLDTLLDAEATATAAPVAFEPRLRLNVSEGFDALPALKPGTGHGWKVFVLDVAVIQGVTGLGVVGSYALGRATGWDRAMKIGKGFVEFTKEHGPVGTGPVAWKDPNYGDPWVNNLAHPANFCAAAKYFRKRGHSPWKAFAGAMATSLAWEYVWENKEIPKSGHDLFFANLLGSLVCSHPDMGLAWGLDPLKPADARGHYTEFYYKPGGDWRVFFRTEPNGDWNNLPEGGRRKAEDKPLWVNDLSLGAAREDYGVTVFVTGVADKGPRDFADVGGVRDVVDDVRIGISLDPGVVFKSLK